MGREKVEDGWTCLKDADEQKCTDFDDMDARKWTQKARSPKSHMEKDIE